MLGRIGRFAAASSCAIAHELARCDPSLPEPASLGRHTAHFSCFRGDGTAADLADVLDAAEKVDVVLVGETHDDPVAHQIELYLLMALSGRRKLQLSMEMFEADVQTVLDEYAAGLIREQDFLQDARPWANYGADYRPLVEFAVGSRIPLVAANAPRRYVGAAGRSSSTLASGAWPAAALAVLPPLPLPLPSASYMRHLEADPAVLRTDQLGLDEAAAANTEATSKAGGALDPAAAAAGKCPYIGLSRRDGLLQPMLLWDAAMALAVSRALEAQPGSLVLHVCGSFHCEKSLGIREMLSVYKPEATALTIVIYPEDEPHAFEHERHGGRADFVLLTDARLPRSHEYLSVAKESG